jgi:hypothetical protein
MLSVMNYWISFGVIILVQGLVLLAVEWIERSFNSRDRHDHTVREALLAAPIGALALGLMFDQLVGRNLMFFQYHLQSTIFAVTNATLSYGIAVATALQFSPKPIPADPNGLRQACTILLLLCAAGIGAAMWLPSALTSAWAIGGIIVTAGELMELSLFRTLGPFLEMLYGNFVRPFRNWITAVSVGAIYELSNYFFPFGTGGSQVHRPQYFSNCSLFYSAM